MKLPVRFFICFLILFGVLAWPWPSVHAITQTVFRVQTSWVAETLFRGRALAVHSLSDPRYPRLDVAVTPLIPNMVGAPEAGMILQIPFDSLSQGYIPIAMLTALFLATPVPWSRRWRSFLAGLFVLELIVLATIYVGIAFGLEDMKATHDHGVMLLFAHHLLGENVWFSFMPPLVWWFGGMSGAITGGWAKA
jgi:hypothetical protein